MLGLIFWIGGWCAIIYVGVMVVGFVMALLGGIVSIFENTDDEYRD